MSSFRSYPSCQQLFSLQSDDNVPPIRASPAYRPAAAARLAEGKGRRQGHGAVHSLPAIVCTGAGTAAAGQWTRHDGLSQHGRPADSANERSWHERGTAGRQLTGQRSGECGDGRWDGHTAGNWTLVKETTERCCNTDAAAVCPS